MAKKAKARALFGDAEDIVDQDASFSENQLNAESKSEDTPNTAVEDFLDSKKMITKEIEEKLERYEALESSNVQLSKANDELMEKISQYLDEIAELRSKVESFANVESESSKYKNQLKSLQDENDSYLMKISELSFENAKLTSQLQELKSSRQQSDQCP